VKKNNRKTYCPELLMQLWKKLKIKHVKRKEKRSEGEKENEVAKEESEKEKEAMKKSRGEMKKMSIDVQKRLCGTSFKKKSASPEKYSALLKTSFRSSIQDVEYTLGIEAEKEKEKDEREMERQREYRRKEEEEREKKKPKKAKKRPSGRLYPEKGKGGGLEEFLRGGKKEPPYVKFTEELIKTFKEAEEGKAEDAEPKTLLQYYEKQKDKVRVEREVQMGKEREAERRLKQCDDIREQILYGEVGVGVEQVHKGEGV